MESANPQRGPALEALGPPARRSQLSSDHCVKGWLFRRARAGFGLLLTACVCAVSACSSVGPRELRESLRAHWAEGADPGDWVDWMNDADGLYRWQRPFSKGRTSPARNGRYLMMGYDDGPYWADTWTRGSSDLLVPLPPGFFVLVEEDGQLAWFSEGAELPNGEAGPSWVLIGTDTDITVVDLHAGTRFTESR